MGIVYLLQERALTTDRPTGLYKIGFTTQSGAEQRVRQYRAGNARRLHILHTVTVQNPQVLETKLHRQFKANRVEGMGGDEWFRGRARPFIRAMDGAKAPTPSRWSEVFWALAIGTATGIILLSSL